MSIHSAHSMLCNNLDASWSLMSIPLCSHTLRAATLHSGMTIGLS